MTDMTNFDPQISRVYDLLVCRVHGCYRRLEISAQHDRHGSKLKKLGPLKAAFSTSLSETAQPVTDFFLLSMLVFAHT